MSQETIDRMNRVVSGFDQRVQAAGAAAMGNASPCEGWTARDVVAHVTNNLRRITAALGGGAPTEVADDDDIVAAWGATRDALTAALPSADLTKEIPGPFGAMPADQFLGRIIATDTLVHTWDLARATGGDEVLPDDIIEGAYAGLKPMDAMIRRPGVFADKIPAPDGADLQTEFLCFLGRKV